MASGIRTTSASGYMPQLDALRAVAILTVLLEHWLPQGHPLRIVSAWGTLGVYLFFVLSGFLITEILLRGKDAIDAGVATTGRVLRQFYMRRFLRIFPIYYFALGMGCLLNLPQMRAAWGWHAAYLSNVWVARLPEGVNPGPAGVFWTLAVEEQFYLVWPVFILLMPRRAMFWGVLGAGLSSVVSSYFAFRAEWWGFSLMTPYALQYFGVGGLLAVVRWSPASVPVSEKVLRRLFWIGGMLGVIALLWINKPEAGWLRWGRLLGMPVILAMVFGGMVGTCAIGVRGWMGRVMEWRPVLWVGKVSYGIYVYHMMLLWAVPTVLAVMGLWGSGPSGVAKWFSVRLAVVLGFAGLSWRFLESPINELKRHFPYPRALKRLLAEDIPPIWSESIQLPSPLYSGERAG